MAQLTETEQKMLDNLGPLLADQVVAKLATMNQDQPAPLDSEQVREIVQSELGQSLKPQFIGLSQAIIEDLPAKLTHHICMAQDCGTCEPLISKIRAETLAKIDERVPGTREALANWDALNTPAPSELAEATGD